MANIAPKPVVVVVVVLLFSSPVGGAGVCLLSDGLDEELGCGDMQATHLVSDGLFRTTQTSQSHEPVTGLNRSPNPVGEEEEVVVAGVEEAVDSVVVCCDGLSGSGELRATEAAKPRGTIG